VVEVFGVGLGGPQLFGGSFGSLVGKFKNFRQTPGLVLVDFFKHA